MKVVFGINRIKKFHKPVVALGVFDGVHLGHQRILKGMVKKAKAIRGTSIVITFWPHPQKEDSLLSLGHRLKIMNDFGIDICIVIKFNQAFSKTPAENFIRDILIERLNAKYLYVGKNFRFGKGAKGDFRLLKKLSGIYNFKLRIFDVIKISHQPISSTYIRKLITRGKLSPAERLLNRPVSIFGTVIKGISLARSWGFPTANILPHHEVLPPQGVYAVWVILNHQKFKGVCYIGRKPTLRTQSAKKHIEVYIFNFKRNIYSKDLEIQFIKKIRDEIKFSSLWSLKEQVKKDITHTRNLFSLP